jgi:hypothetical protein
MNIIDAWKKAKVGEKVKCNGFKSGLVNFIKTKDITEDLHDCIAEALLSDDWEVERKPLVWEGVVEWNRRQPSGNIVPNDVTFKTDFEEFIGKRTRIHIEEIVE